MKTLHILSFTIGLGLSAGLGFWLTQPQAVEAAGTPGDPLRSCDYERALVTPVLDSTLFPGQYVAKLACPDAHQVVAGGCMPRFDHNVVDVAGLTGSGPYECGKYDDRPENFENHEDVDGENGWACHFDEEPILFDDPADVAVVVLCCK